MDRRKVLKNIGTGIGAIAVTPTVVGFFQSCQSAVSYTPVFVPQEDFGMLSSIMDLIIPSTDTPGAIELKLPEFIDAYADGVWNEDNKASFKEGWAAFKSAALEASGKANAGQLTAADWDAELAKHLKSGNPPAKGDLAAGFANQLRSLTVNAYKTNEFIGENVLAYAPVPGDYRGCVDLEETTGGKSWSL